MTGRLVLGGAPLGQPGDVGPRLREVLATADVLAVEDTRRLHRLAADLEVTFTGRLVSFYESVEQSRLPGLIAAMRDGGTVLLLTDAGMPSVSDPGYTLVRAAIEAGIDVTSVPGPSAVVTALAVSGLPTDRFCFEGFLPRKGGERRAALAALAAEPRTMVFYESPHRLAEALADAVGAFGADRAAAVCRELTKTHEEVRRGPLAELADWAAEGVRGEITLVVAGAVAGPVVDVAGGARRRGRRRGGRRGRPQGGDPHRRRPHRPVPPGRLRRRRRRQGLLTPAVVPAPCAPTAASSRAGSRSVHNGSGSGAPRSGRPSSPRDRSQVGGGHEERRASRGRQPVEPRRGRGELACGSPCHERRRTPAASSLLRPGEVDPCDEPAVRPDA